MSTERWAEILEPSLKKKSFIKLPPIIAKCGRAVSPEARLLYAIMVDYARENDFCFPGQERLANELGCSVRSLRDYIAELENCRLIETKQRGLRLTNLYRFLPLEKFTEWLNSGPANSAGQDRQVLPPGPANSAGQEVLFSAGPIEEQDTDEQDTATTRPVVVDGSLQGPIRRLRQFGFHGSLPTTIPPLDAVAIGQVADAIAQQHAQGNALGGPFIRRMLEDPGAYGFRADSGAWRRQPINSDGCYAFARPVSAAEARRMMGWPEEGDGGHA